MPDIRNLRNWFATISDTKSDAKPVVKKEPSRRWHNRFWTPYEIDWADAPPDGPGEFIDFEEVYPSYELAEEDGPRWVKFWAMPEENGALGVFTIYLGPVEGEGE